MLRMNRRELQRGRVVCRPGCFVTKWYTLWQPHQISARSGVHAGACSAGVLSALWCRAARALFL